MFLRRLADPMMSFANPDKSDVLVLCYHGVSEKWASPLCVTPNRLRTHLNMLTSKGYSTINFTEAATGRPEGRRVAITFDDGYRSVHGLARPVLEEFSMTATVFVPTAYIGQQSPMSWPGIDEDARGDHAAELEPMNWTEVRELIAAGWEIGSHSVTHPDLTELDDAQLQHELTTSRKKCEEELGIPCKSIAFPYGAVDSRVVAATRTAGYEAGAALMYSEAPESALALRRVGLHQPDSSFSFSLKTSRMMRKLWRTPVWPAIGWSIAKIRRQFSG